jgi:ABC-2 type transport system ATP-binding protein
MTTTMNALPSSPRIEVSNLVKKFNSHTVVDNVSFELEEKEILGLLGPNGAGKSTVLNLILDLIPPGSGVIRIGGFDLSKERDDAKSLVGYCPQQDSLYESMNTEEHLRFYADINKVPKNIYKYRSERVLKELGLESHRHKYPKELSGGMRRRTSIACAIIHEPEILILDEPTSGLDPVNRRKMWEVITELRNKGKSIISTTHYMDEAEEFCDRIAIMNSGKLIAIGPPEDMKKKIIGGESVIELALEETNAKIVSRLLELDSEGINLVIREEQRLKVFVNDLSKSLELVSNSIKNAGGKIIDINPLRVTLEDVFIKLTGETINQDYGNTGVANQVITQHSPSTTPRIIFIDFTPETFPPKRLTESIKSQEKNPIVHNISTYEFDKSSQPRITKITSTREKGKNPILHRAVIKSINYYCPRCRIKLPERDLFCPNCGQKR